VDTVLSFFFNTVVVVADKIPRTDTLAVQNVGILLHDLVRIIAPVLLPVVNPQAGSDHEIIAGREFSCGFINIETIATSIKGITILYSVALELIWIVIRNME